FTTPAGPDLVDRAPHPPPPLALPRLSRPLGAGCLQERKCPPELEECAAQIASTAQGGHLAGAGYQLASPLRSHLRRRARGRPPRGGAVGRAGRPAPADRRARGAGRARPPAPAPRP